jgi:hypothetical protein
MNLGQWGTSPSTSGTPARRRVGRHAARLLPDGATGGMCDLTPEIVSAQVFAADGVTPFPARDRSIPAPTTC